MTDRIAGVILVLLALWYGFGASRLKAGFGADPLGPKVFPFMLAITLFLVALAIIFRVDPNPPWPRLGTWFNLVFVTISFIAYAYLLVPIGFIAATTLETTFVSQRFGAKAWQAIVTGLLASLGMYVLFVYALGIPLPVGRVFGGR
ncbi:MAG: tripartite tricarboxylate transporter TctB family protein [Trueperaceae bacterium]|nr:MAG: tripartite tricarboxylate transporter TctB family protein [Trueperaceae bacterium]